MKQTYLIIKSLVIIFILGTSVSVAQTTVDKAIESKKFKIEITSVSPKNAATITPNVIYTLNLRNDSVITYLPYFGRSYTPVFSNNKGLTMEEPYTDYKVTPKKKKTLISFAVRNQDDVYKYDINISQKGDARINVSMRNKQSISFDGKLILSD